jgi:hypothetical protein
MVWSGLHRDGSGVLQFQDFLSCSMKLTRRAVEKLLIAARNLRARYAERVD